MAIIQLNEGISLLSGSTFNYNDPESCDVKIEDVACALSKVCRFSGHIHYFYSVAQHCVNTSYIVSPEFAFEALMHDTAEAFTNDLPTPLKAALPIFKELEVKIESTMSKKFNFNYPFSPAIKLADLQMLKMEKEKIKRDKDRWPLLDGIETNEVIDLVDLTMWTPPQAEKKYLNRFWELYNGGNEQVRRERAA
jgi:hypothetical protein